MRIAIDFDGTIVEHDYPRIGKPIPNAIEVIKKLSDAGHDLILWTYRHGDYLQSAVEYCEENGLSFYAVNENEPEEDFNVESDSRLIEADVFIDDRNIGGLLPWLEIEKLLLNN